MNSSCHICNSDRLDVIAEFSRLKRVTSDCKPWPENAPLGICSTCGTVQGLINDHWRADCRRIYEGYTIYHQGSGAEQCVFDSTGNPAARSEQLIEKLNATKLLPASGSLLDIGCGNGSFLRRFSSSHPDWRLYGSEYNETHRNEVASIPGVCGFFTGDILNLDQTFDAVSLIHVLEHLEAPCGFLRNIRRILKPGGLLIIELPSYANNPFELLIADHASHFDPGTIRTLTETAGFQIEIIEDQWIPKELSVLARNTPPFFHSTTPNYSARFLHQRAAWLFSVAAHARSIMESSPHFGIFGTSIAATWMLGELAFQPAFLVDEDPNRAGRIHCGLPILHPKNVPPGSDVYVGLSPIISDKVARRLARPDSRYHCVPNF